MAEKGTKRQTGKKGATTEPRDDQRTRGGKEKRGKTNERTSRGAKSRGGGAAAQRKEPATDPSKKNGEQRAARVHSGASPCNDSPATCASFACPLSTSFQSVPCLVRCVSSGVRSFCLLLVSSVFADLVGAANTTKKMADSRLPQRRTAAVGKAGAERGGGVVAAVRCCCCDAEAGQPLRTTERRLTERRRAGQLCGTS